MEHSEHLLRFAENKQSFYKKLLALATMGNFIGTVDRFNAANKLVSDVFIYMRRNSEISSTVDETDLAKAVVLFLEWRFVA